MERPHWVSEAGVVGIFLACLGIVNGIGAMLLPSIYNFVYEIKQERQMLSELDTSNTMQQETDSTVEMTAANQTTTTDSTNELKKIKKNVKIGLQQSNAFIVAGLIYLCLSGFFLFSSITLLQLKSFAPLLFYLAVTSLIIFPVIGIYLLVSSGIIFGMIEGAGIFSAIFVVAIVSVAMLIFVLVKDKTAFHPPKAAIVRPVEKD